MDILHLMQKEMLRRGLSHETIATYTQCARQFMKSCQKEPRKATKRDIQEHLDRLIEKGRCGNTINVHLNALKFMMEEVLCKRVMLRIKFSKRPKTLPVFLTKDETIRMLEAVQNPKHKLILEMIYSAGLRVGEAIKLRKQDLEPERNRGWVRKGKGNKDRPFIIANCLRQKIEDCMSSQESIYLFPGRKGHITARSVQEIVKKAAKKAGISKKVHPHSLRHSFATHLIENGYDIATVQPLLGHNSAETTLMYIHMSSPKMISVRSPYDEVNPKT